MSKRAEQSGEGATMGEGSDACSEPPSAAALRAKAKSLSPEVILERVRGLRGFTSWDGRTVYQVWDIKPYCVAGISPTAKGLTAIWLRSPKAKRAQIIFPEVVQVAIRFIADPKSRRDRIGLAPATFSSFLRRGRSRWRSFPHLYAHAGIYLALGKLLLDLPANWKDSATEKALKTQQERFTEDHPNISRIDGLIREVSLVYAESLQWEPMPDLAKQTDAFGRSVFSVLWSRHGSSARMDDQDDLQADLVDLSRKVRSDSTHADINRVPFLMFALLYLNGLQWIGRIRGSAVTGVVNRLADAWDAGLLAPAVERMSEDAADASRRREAAWEETVSRLFRTRRRGP